jgi:flagellin
MSMTRIGANLSAMRSMDRLFHTNREIRRRLIRLASGKRINRVDEDPAGFSLVRGLESRGRSLLQAADNVATARNVLAIAEGAYRAISDILLTIVEKVVQGADDAYNVDQRAAIQGQIDALVDEIDAIVEETSFNGTQLIDGSFVNKVFQTGPDAGDVMRVNLENAHSSAFTGFRNGFDVIAGVNDRLVFIEDGVTLTATLTPGSYTLTGLATELESALDAASVRPGVNYGM